MGDKEALFLFDRFERQKYFAIDQIPFILVSDGQKGVWYYTSAANLGLFHVDAQGRQVQFNSANSKLPSDDIDWLRNDGQGGIWVRCLETLSGSPRQGFIVHLEAQGIRHIFNENASVHDKVAQQFEIEYIQ